MLVRNADIVLKDGILKKGTVRVSGGRITLVGSGEEVALEESAICADGYYLTPGFIDLHIHLGYLQPRYSFVDELDLCAEHLPQNGTTRYLPTLVSALQGMLPAQFQEVADRMEKQSAGAHPLGVHLEGPYIAPGARGAFSLEQITTPELFSMKAILDEGAGLVRIMMVAPELPGSIPVIEDLGDRGIVAALGHTLAGEEVYTEARRAGASHCTHTYNNRRNFPESPTGGRGFNLDDLAVADDDVTCELICDGVHVKPVWVKTIYRTNGCSKLSLITDSFLCGQRGREGAVFEVNGGTRLTVRSGVGRDDAGGLAGSVVTQDQALRKFIELSGAPLWEAVECLTLAPATTIGMENDLGSIEVGKAADLVLLDRDLHPRWAMVDGRVCWSTL